MLPDPQATYDRYQFGPFEADTRTSELSLNGERIPCQDVPFRFLVALLERPGELVSRDQLRQQIWPPDLNLDFVRALDSAAFKVRQALGDSARTPRYLETLPGKGYRFIGEVVTLPPSAAKLNTRMQPGDGLGRHPALVTPFRRIHPTDAGFTAYEADSEGFNSLDSNQPAADATATGQVPVVPMPWLRRVRLGLAVAAALALALGVMLLVRPRAPSFEPYRVAMAPFENRTGEPALDNLGLQVVDLVCKDLQFVQNVKVAMDTPVPPGSGDPLRRLAEVTNAHIVMVCTCYARGGEVEFQARLVDPWKRRVVYALGPWRGPREDPVKAILELRQSLGGAIGWSLQDNGLEPGATHPPRLDALQALLKERAFQAGDAKSTLAACDEALALDPDFLWARLRKISVLMDIDRYGEADVVLAGAEPYFGICTSVEREMLRWFRAALGSRPLEALNALENIRVIHPDTVFFRYKRAQLEMAANRPHSAIRDLSGIPPEELYRLMGGADWRPAYNLTNAQHVVGGFSAQLVAARTAENHYPDVLNFRVQEAAALVALGRLQELDPVLGAATGVATRPGTATQVEMKCLVVEELRAHGYLEASERLAAQALAECQSESAPASAHARVSKAVLLSHLGRSEEALAIYRRLAAEDPKDVGPTWAAGSLLARLGRVDEARRIEMELATTSFPHLCGENSYGRACIAAQLGERDRAVTLLGKAFEQGWYFSNEMHRELFLEPLRGFPSYEALLKAKD